MSSHISLTRCFKLCALAMAVILTLGSLQTWAQSVTFNFEDLTDQGFGTGFGDDASKTFPIVNIGGSNRMEVLRTGAFQEAGNQTGNPASPLFQTLLAASANEANATLSYDWYVDTSLAPGQYGNYLQAGTFYNTGSGYYGQNFPSSGKELELNGTQLASGQVFSGTVSYNLGAAGINMPPAETFFRFGLILNGDGAQAKVYFDNITITVVPEPASLGLVAMGLLGCAFGIRRRK